MSPQPDHPLTLRARLSLAAVLAVVLTGAVVASGCCSPRVQQPRGEDTARTAYSRTVRVKVTCTTGEQGGSGVRVGGSLVLTAAHVVDCGAGELVMITVQTHDGASYISTLEGTSPADIARIDGLLIPSMPPVRITAPVVGEPLCATFAFPEWGRRCGEVWPSAKDTDIHINFVAEQGNSGGGIWAADGSLVGLVATLRYCLGTPNRQVCNAGMTTLAPRRWLLAQ